MSALGWVAVGLLGGAAAGARYLLDSEISRRTSARLPLGILAVNLLGALAIGVLVGQHTQGEEFTILAGGLIGSFTTFSTLILDTHLLSKLPGGVAWLNVGVSMAGGFFAVYLGQVIAAR